MTLTQEPLDLPLPRPPTLTEQRATTPHTPTPATILTDPEPPPRMHRITGIDYSLTATGIGIITQRVNRTCIINTTTIKSIGHDKDPTAVKAERLNQLAHDIYYAASNPTLAVFEGLSFHSKGKLDRLWAGWWMTITLFAKANIPIAIISPTSTKLATTGDSRADKSVMGGHLRKLWPELDYSNENEADAAALAHLGAARLGWNIVTLERHKQVKAEWPQYGAGSAIGLTELEAS